MKNIKSSIVTLTILLATLASFGLIGQASALRAPDPATADKSAGGGAGATPTASATAAAAAPAAAPTDSKTAACDALKQLDSTKKCDGKDKGVDTLVKSIVNLLSYVVGIVAVIMVIIGGFKYVTSSGDPANVSSAKNSLLYALVGIFIVALAQFLVHFVLSTAAKT